MYRATTTTTDYAIKYLEARAIYWLVKTTSDTQENGQSRQLHQVLSSRVPDKTRTLIQTPKIKKKQPLLHSVETSETSPTDKKGGRARSSTLNTGSLRPALNAVMATESIKSASAATKTSQLAPKQ